MTSKLTTLRATTVTAAAVAGAMLISLPAAAAPATANYVEAGPGHSGVTIDETAESGARDAGFFRFQVEGGDTVYAVCIQYDVDLNTDGEFVATDRDGLPVDATAIGRAAWIGMNHTSVGTPLESDSMEAVAAAMAGWTFTDGKQWDESNMLYPDARERAEELRAAAQDADPVPAGPTSFALELDTDRDGDDVIATATLATDDGDPLAGEDITVTFTNGTEATVTTDDSGQVAVTAEDLDEAGEVAASWSGVLTAGSVLDSQDEGQLVVTLEDAGISRTAEASFDAPEVEPDPEPEPEPETDETPEDPAPTPEEPVEDEPADPEPTTTREELPFTGPGLIIPLLIAAGGGLAGLGYRMRNRATASLS